jgi:hypothetical protein
VSKVFVLLETKQDIGEAPETRILSVFGNEDAARTAFLCKWSEVGDIMPGEIIPGDPPEVGDESVPCAYQGQLTSDEQWVQLRLEMWEVKL